MNQAWHGHRPGWEGGGTLGVSPWVGWSPSGLSCPWTRDSAVTPRKASVSRSTRSHPGGRARQGTHHEHPDLAAHPSRTSSCPGSQRQDIPTSPPHFPVGCRKGLYSSRGLTVNGTTCSLHSNCFVGQGHGDAGNRDHDTCSPAHCREARAWAPQHSPRAGTGGPGCGSGWAMGPCSGGAGGLRSPAALCPRGAQESPGPVASP